jgi:TonB family protein
MVGPDLPAPPSPAPTPTPPANGLSTQPAPILAPTPPQAPSGGALGQSLRNLRQALRNENFDNQLGGQADQSADIQFDSMGVDFGPWLRRFKNQVERNWIVPQAAMVLKGRVVVQFYVLRNGTIADLRVVQPSSVQPFTTAAFNALKLSNPTAELPREYPADRAFFTVTFHYNEGRDDR